MKKKIYIKHWLEFKPYNTPTNTDLYYLQLSNKVYDKLKKNEEFYEFTKRFEIDIKLLSCFLTSYLEDLVSETRIWSSFVSLHQKIYGKILPFFGTNEKNYFEGEPNMHDIWFFNMVLYEYRSRTNRCQSS